MRNDAEGDMDFNTIGARTQSEVAEAQDCFGFNSLKIARYLNMIGGSVMTVFCGIRMFNIF